MFSSATSANTIATVGRRPCTKKSWLESDESENSAIVGASSANASAARWYSGPYTSEMIGSASTIAPTATGSVIAISSFSARW